MRFFLILSFLLSLSFSAMAGGPWPQKKGEGFYKLFQYWVIADQHYTDTGEIDPNVTTGFFSTNLYAEYGITDRLTAVAYLPLFVRTYYNNEVSATTGETLEPGDDFNSIGDIDLSFTYGIIRDRRVVMSASVLLGIPSGQTGKGGLGILQTGDGEFNQMLKVDVGTGFKLGSLNMYSSAYAGYNNRTNDFSDEFRYGFEAGATFWNDKITAIARFTGIESMQNGSAPSLSEVSSLFSNNQEYLAFSPEVAYNFSEKWGVSATYNTVFFGKLIMANPAYSVGVFLKM
ncbi:hypothetical protein [Sediminitomix flava]|uniref:Outer membrane beta-barrel porin/alpha-amylase n=1 Tax=Sediminitomix flava TaxID=379075 RepID=A0A315Z5I5_SEDFL|nr:hypothetical protein [Sediminitomix flava]PWJ39163.1 hypothetical protein BC781_10664 [Sediminitomix flava]